jgi:hypothetical protein
LVYYCYCNTTGRITTGRKLKKERRNKESSKGGEKEEEK